MKCKTTALTLLCVLILFLCSACTSAAPPPSSSDTASPSPPAENSAPADETSGSPSPAPPVEYNFSEVVSDEYTLSLTGFEGLPWGYQLPQALTDDLGGIQQYALVNSSVSFAGLNFQAHYLFNSSFPGTAEEARTLSMGQYVRIGYAYLNQQADRTELAVSDFNQVLAYLTGLYGNSDSYTIRYTQESGRGSEPLSAPLTPAQMRDPEAKDCSAFWNGLEGARIVLQLNEANGGMLSVTFMRTQA